MPSVDPATLKAARLAQGMSLAVLAERSGLSSPTLSRLENGSRESTEAETSSLSAALQMPVAALCRPLVSARLGLSAFYHRKLSTAGARAVDRVENQCVLDVVALREMFGMIDVPHPDVPLTIHLDEAKGDPEQAARMTRQRLSVARGPIRDIFEVVESAGCVVIHTDFGIPEMDAMYQQVRGVPPIFWVNSRKPLERVRWSLAHELGHLVMHEEEPVDEKLAEDQANAFAGEFLMPAADFRGECPSNINLTALVELKRRWRCSMQAIARRAEKLRRITPQQLKNIMIGFSKQGWRKQEPYPITGESPTLLARCVRSCLNTCQLTEEELAERLAISVGQVRSWQQPFPGQRASPDAPQPRLRLVSGF